MYILQAQIRKQRAIPKNVRLPIIEPFHKSTFGQKMFNLFFKLPRG